MQYKDTELTINNYNELLSNKESDIKEVVKHAILDNTDIGKYIDTVDSDSYKLLQIKISVQENIHERYIFINGDGESIKLMRKAVQSGLDLSPINAYISPIGGLTVSSKVIKYILSAYLSNADIGSIDFTGIKNEDAVYEICRGLELGYPMSLFTDLESKSIALVIRGMQLNYDMTIFASGFWSEEQILLILSANVDYAELIKYLTSDFTIAQIEYIIDAINSNLDIEDITTLYKGKPPYSAYQMEEMILAKKQGVFSDDFLVKSMSPNSMAHLRMSLLYEKANSKEVKQD